MTKAANHHFDPTEAIAAAVRAPSLHNRQPWRFRVRDRTIEVRLDPDRRPAATDPTGWAARLAVGAALFNLRLAVAGQGWQPVVRRYPDPADPGLLATLALGARRPASPEERRLAAAIWRRRSNRSSFRPDPVPAKARAKLVAAARAEDGWLELLIGPGPAAAVTELAWAADQVLRRDPAYQAELAAWQRAATAGPGVGGETSGAEAGQPGAGGEPPGGPEQLPVRPYGSPVPAQPVGSTQPVVAVLGTAGDTAVDQLVAGQALQRVLLTATDDELATSMVSQPIEVPSIREQLRIALGQYGAPQMVLRIGYGPPGAPTSRRPASDAVIIDRT